MANLRFSSSDVEQAAVCLDQGTSGVNVSEPAPEPCCTQYVSRIRRPITQLNKEDQDLKVEVDKAQNRLRESIRIFETADKDVEDRLIDLQRGQG